MCSKYRTSIILNIILIFNLIFELNCHQHDSISTFRLQSGYNKPIDFVSTELYINGERTVKTIAKSKDLLRNYIGKLKTTLKNIKRLESPDTIYNFYNDIAIILTDLERNSEKFYKSSRNEIQQLLGRMKKLQIRYMHPPIRDEMSDYYHEMDQFVYILTITIDNFDEFISEQLRRIRTTFENVANIQKDILGIRKLLQEEWCQLNYKQFLVFTTQQIHKCSAANMRIVYDVFAISKLNIYYLIGELEHRVQKVFNCFEKQNYQLYCGFIKDPINEFDNMFSKLNELLIYNDKQKLSRNILMKTYQKNQRNSTMIKQRIYCLPDNYPEEQLMDGLQSCFSYWD